jgi:hypothetical protein
VVSLGEVVFWNAGFFVVLAVLTAVIRRRRRWHSTQHIPPNPTEYTHYDDSWFQFPRAACKFRIDDRERGLVVHIPQDVVASRGMNWREFILALHDERGLEGIRDDRRCNAVANLIGPPTIIALLSRSREPNAGFPRPRIWVTGEQDTPDPTNEEGPDAVLEELRDNEDPEHGPENTRSPRRQLDL